MAYTQLEIYSINQIKTYKQTCIHTHIQTQKTIQTHTHTNTHTYSCYHDFVYLGGCVAGVVGTKIPHYSIFGETVEMAGLMESSGEPIKIQVVFICPAINL